jgi:hypothetical protein
MSASDCVNKNITLLHALQIGSVEVSKNKCACRTSYINSGIKMILYLHDFGRYPNLYLDKYCDASQTHECICDINRSLCLANNHECICRLHVNLNHRDGCFNNSCRSAKHYCVCETDYCKSETHNCMCNKDVKCMLHKEKKIIRD